MQALLLCLVLGGVAADEPKADPSAELKRLWGAWRPESVTEDGRRLMGDDLAAFRGMTLTLEAGRGTLRNADGVAVALYEAKVDASREPRTFDFRGIEGLDEGKLTRGIWKFDGDALIWCFGRDSEGRPRGFESRVGTDVILMVMRRPAP